MTVTYAAWIVEPKHGYTVHPTDRLNSYATRLADAKPRSGSGSRASARQTGPIKLYALCEAKDDRRRDGLVTKRPRPHIFVSR